MLGIAQNPSTRIASKGLLCLRAVIVALLVPSDDLGAPGDVDYPEDLPERLR